MDLWTYRRYRRPALAVDAIDVPPGQAVVALRSGARTYHLAVDDEEGARHIADSLATLRRADCPLWEILRAAGPDESWADLATFLDTRSLIRESREDAALQQAAESGKVRDILLGTLQAARAAIPRDRRAAVRANAMIALYALLDVNQAPSSGLDPFDARTQPNFFLGLLALEFEYLRDASPPTLAAAEVLLGELAGAPGSTNRLESILAEASGVYDLRDLAAHLWLIARAVLMSVEDSATRLPSPTVPDLALNCGLEFMRQTELLTRDALAMWGPNPYAEAIRALTDPMSPLVAGPFIEQYHVTRRFVEIIAPLLSRRLAPPLRALVFRYYGEEVGHEALESTNCQRLGVTEAALNQALPLPLHFAFVDILTLLADTDPLTAFASIMVIEGVFGEPPRMSLRIAAVGRDNPAYRGVSDEHDELNETLNHNSIARDAFETISAISPDRQKRVMRKILFMLELNHRAWAGITDFYASQPRLLLQGPFGRPLEPGPA